MKFICTILLSLFLIPAFAQPDTATNNSNDSTYVADYYKLRALYIKYIDSKKTTKTDKLLREFMMKAKFDGEMKELASEDGLIIWVRENIKKTAFRSVVEADELWQELQIARQVRPQEELDFYEEEKKMSEKHGRKIIMDVRLNRGAGDRDPKEDPEYKAAYEKLKALTIEHNKSESFRKIRSLDKEYSKKANFDHRKDKVVFPKTMYDWVEQNLSRTTFTSLTDAKREWNKIEDAKAAERKENEAFYDFNDECLSKYGHYMTMDIMMEVMTME
ncbi:hypothetical protein AM493_04450 [Flavobacterium akiainvivens]|uniref:DUF3826 domain-containing protein n=1 Tax=Flavobacterium akiainvivens TaxID=1202724 RepID=A0A0M8M9J6_9FLAO|nr:hypothetical protein [Flavobacterium akiainvivens]KOS05365.1 hypothetical protein AM493_04450 [Flavobacterium akiainvivens]SFQ73948.1 hypothetical protein SAMN05444144_11960 [Flavobacterium akiainvivens]